MDSGLKEFLTKAVGTGLISQEMGDRMLVVLDTNPSITPGEDGSVALSWSGEKYYIELEFFENSPTECFIKNKESGTLIDLELI